MRIDRTSGILIPLGIAVGAGLLAFALWPNGGSPRPKPGENHRAAAQQMAKPAVKPSEGKTEPVFTRLPSGALVRPGETLPPLEPETESQKGERAASAEWKSVLDRYSNPLDRKISDEDIANFKKALQGLSPSHRRENLKVASGRIPDKNFAVIAYLALDNSLPGEIVSDAFDACLNRNCESSLSVIDQIARDKTHAHYVDAARIRDVRKLAERQR